MNKKYLVFVFVLVFGVLGFGVKNSFAQDGGTVTIDPTAQTVTIAPKSGTGGVIGDGGNFTLRWGKVDGAIRYEIYFFGPDGKVVGTEKITDTLFDFDPEKYLGAKTWGVKALGEKGKASPLSEIAGLPTVPSGLSAPKGLNASSSNNGCKVFEEAKVSLNEKQIGTILGTIGYGDNRKGFLEKIFNFKEKSLIKQAQQKYGLPETGVISPALQEKVLMDMERVQKSVPVATPVTPPSIEGGTITINPTGGDDGKGTVTINNFAFTGESNQLKWYQWFLTDPDANGVSQLLCVSCDPEAEPVCVPVDYDNCGDL